jgi:hypothetical protein
MLGILALAVTGTLAELLLLEHYDGWRQWIPLAVLGVTTLTLAWHAFRPGRGSTRVLRVVMSALVVAGAAGVILHIQGNLEFEAELNPGLTGWPLWIEVARGATPTLAPGSLVPFGLLGLLYSWRFRYPTSQE